jgi:hypothetical protein
MAAGRSGVDGAGLLVYVPFPPSSRRSLFDFARLGSPDSTLTKEGFNMKAIMLLTGEGTLVILTSYQSPTDRALLKKLQDKGIEKFVAYEIPLDLAKERYGQHFTSVSQDLRESDDLRVLDYSGNRAFKLFSLRELGPSIECEAGEAVTESSAQVRRTEDK